MNNFCLVGARIKKFTTIYYYFLHIFRVINSYSSTRTSIIVATVRAYMLQWSRFYAAYRFVKTTNMCGLNWLSTHKFSSSSTVFTFTSRLKALIGLLIGLHRLQASSAPVWLIVQSFKSLISPPKFTYTLTPGSAPLVYWNESN